MRNFLRRWLGLEEDRRANEQAARNLVTGLWEKVNALEKYLVVADPAIDDPLVCQCGRKGLMVMAVLEEVDSKTYARRPVGAGLYCPKCGSSFYSTHGHSWAVQGTTVETDKGMPPHTPAAVHRDPEPAERKLKFRR